MVNDHYPYEKWLLTIGNINPTFSGPNPYWLQQIICNIMIILRQYATLCFLFSEFSDQKGREVDQLGR